MPLSRFRVLDSSYRDGYLVKHAALYGGHQANAERDQRSPTLMKYEQKHILQQYSKENKGQKVREQQPSVLISTESFTFVKYIIYIISPPQHNKNLWFLVSNPGSATN